MLRLSEELAESGVHLIDLTMGEDLQFHQEDFESVIEIIRKIKQEPDLRVVISPGVVSDVIINKLADAGTDWYALYQETHNRKLFESLRIGQSFDDRMHAKLFAAEQGMLIEEGIMSGIGESHEDMPHSLIRMGEIGAGQMRVMSFVPQKGVPRWKVPKHLTG